MSPVDLSVHAESRLVVDVFTNLDNRNDSFDLELIDAAGRTGKWSFGDSHLEPVLPYNLVASTTLANPTDRIGDFANLDLDEMTIWQVVGSFAAPSAFNMSFDRVLVSDTPAAPPAQHLMRRGVHRPHCESMPIAKRFSPSPSAAPLQACFFVRVLPVQL